jgi:murein DD-endopeptidase MepM/ murein hydrolase activator NlpD
MKQITIDYDAARDSAEKDPRFSLRKATIFDLSPYVERVANETGVSAFLIWAWVINERGWWINDFVDKSHNYWGAMGNGNHLMFSSFDESTKVFIRTILNRWEGDGSEAANNSRYMLDEGRKFDPFAPKARDLAYEWGFKRMRSKMNGHDSSWNVANNGGQVAVSVYNHLKRFVPQVETASSTPSITIKDSVVANGLYISALFPDRDLPTLYYTSPYGRRGAGFHPGIDIAPAVATYNKRGKDGYAILAPCDGYITGAHIPYKVPYNRIANSYGNILIFRPGPDSGCDTSLAIAFGHLRGDGDGSRYAGANGLFVPKGTILCYIGDTGASSGPHLHLEVRKLSNLGAQGNFLTVSQWYSLTAIDPITVFADLRTMVVGRDLSLIRPAATGVTKIINAVADKAESLIETVQSALSNDGETEKKDIKKGGTKQRTSVSSKDTVKTILPDNTQE